MGIRDTLTSGSGRTLPMLADAVVSVVTLAMLAIDYEGSRARRSVPFTRIKCAKIVHQASR